MGSFTTRVRAARGVALLGLIALFGACSDGGTTKDGGARDTRSIEWGPSGDALVCHRPPTIASCIFPPGSSCTDKVLCLGCNCSGMFSVYACNGLTKDCRWFCTGCYPADYTICDKKAPKAILGLCSYCYSDAGPADKCDKVKRDAGATAKDSGKKPRDSGGQ